MPAPSPSFIVADPPPLNPVGFPYRVDEFPADGPPSLATSCRSRPAKSNVEDTAPTAEQNGTHFAFPIAAICTSAFIEQIFAHLDKTSSDKAAKIVASAQVAWREGGRGFASRTFPVWICQDENR